MQSNTKLTPDQKEERKLLLKSMPNVTLVNNAETTFAYQEKGNTVELSLSVKSDNEKKFRSKVGEYHALRRWYDGQTVKMKTTDFFDMLDTCYGI